MKQTPIRTQASRSKKRMNYNMEIVHAILDEAHACTVSYVEQGEPRALPTGYVRIDDRIYIHGSVKSHFFSRLAEAETVCITAFLLDGLVLAKSGVNHSFNYRSVVLFASPERITGRKEKDRILAAFTDVYVPGRWEEIRQPLPQELDATGVLGFTIKEASAKIRQGPPNDLQKDKQLPVWSGVVPFKMSILQPVPDENNTGGNLPEYLKNLVE